MSSPGLFSSLFRDNSFSLRSSSMFHKSFPGQQPKQQRARSQSTYGDKNNNNMSNRYLPVARMTHMLAVKIKKLNYFLFCSLQANFKKFRATAGNSGGSASKDICKSDQKLTLIQKQVGNNKKQVIQKQAIAKGLQFVHQIFQLNSLKYQNSHKIEESFRKIKKFSKIKQSTHSLWKVLDRKIKDNISKSFKKLQQHQKSLLKAEIFAQATVNTFQPKIKTIFKLIRQAAINNKIKQEIESRENSTQKDDRFQNLDGYYLKPNNDRLKSISEEGSEIISEEETARYATPQKGNINKKSYNEELQKSKTSRKQSRTNLALQRKSTKKQVKEESEKSSTFKSNTKFYEDSEQKCMQKYTNIRASTKKQPHRPRIFLSKNYKIQTNLCEQPPLKISNIIKNIQAIQTQKMLKHNRLHSENLPHMLPDLHDNMGVFQSMWATESNYYIEQSAMSHRTIEKSKNISCDMESQKTVSYCKQKNYKELDEFKDDQVQLYELRHTEDITFQKDSNNKTTTTVNSRALTNSFSNPKFCETGINTSTQQTKQTIQSNINNNGKGKGEQNVQNNDNYQFYSSPLYKIQEMMMDLEKLREKEKFASKYTSGYQKCKLSVNLPKKSYEGRSHQNSASKNTNNISSKLTECRSQKRQIGRGQILSKRFSYKENKDHKENIEVKLWDQKQKFFFYAQPSQAKQRKKSSGMISSMNQSQINTARKMKKQIENIINNRKSRTSLGSLKLIKSKY